MRSSLSSQNISRMYSLNTGYSEEWTTSIMSQNLTDRARRIYELTGMDVEPSMLCRIIRAAMIESRDPSGKVNLFSLYDLTNELDKE